ncbi:MAG: hypothetical protein IMW89_08830 [Ktedonobacteraceae bacterium]|nr:hypothetical protein [Ktedonobacteraceae bacterium]
MTPLLQPRERALRKWPCIACDQFVRRRALSVSALSASRATPAVLTSARRAWLIRPTSMPTTGRRRLLPTKARGGRPGSGGWPNIQVGRQSHRRWALPRAAIPRSAMHRAATSCSDEILLRFLGRETAPSHRAWLGRMRCSPPSSKR